MILNGKDICKMVADDNQIDYNLLLSINNTVFLKTKEWTRNPTSLKVYIKGIGSWFYRKTKTKDNLNFLNNLILENTIFRNEKEYQNAIKKSKVMTFILKEYETYIQDRYDKKCEKYGKEAYEAYKMAKKQEKIQKTQEAKSK